MIRPFNLRDLALVHRLSERGILLQAQASLTTSPHPLRNALVNMLVGGHFTTFVWKSDAGEQAAFVQLAWEAGWPSAQMVCLGVRHEPGEADRPVVDEEIWLPLLDQLAYELGQRGIHNLVAEVSETGPELPILRQAGFAVYTRQDVWKCEQPVTAGDVTLQPRQTLDDWDIQLLYANNVPRLIQLVEPDPPVEQGENWVLREDGELAALVHFKTGQIGSWMQVLIHPNAHTSPQAIVAAALQTKTPSVDRPVYGCVRRYQSWLQGALEANGFQLFGSQAVMVKHFVNHLPGPEKVKPTHVLEGQAQAVPGSTPMIQSFSGQQQNGRSQNK